MCSQGREGHSGPAQLMVLPEEAEAQRKEGLSKVTANEGRAEGLGQRASLSSVLHQGGLGMEESGT